MRRRPPATVAALELKPDYADAHAELSVVLTLLGKPEEAAACMQEALRLKPNFCRGVQQPGRSSVGDGGFCARRSLVPRGCSTRSSLHVLARFSFGRPAARSRPGSSFASSSSRCLRFAAPIYALCTPAWHRSTTRRKEYAKAAHHAAEANAIDKIVRRDRGQAFEPEETQALHRYGHRQFHAGILRRRPRLGAGVGGSRSLSLVCRAPGRRWSNRFWRATPRSMAPARWA